MANLFTLMENRRQAWIDIVAHLPADSILRLLHETPLTRGQLQAWDCARFSA
jgi:hypothetical protein